MAYFNSHLSEHRSPFGAVRTEQIVKFNIKFETMHERRIVYLHLFDQKNGQKFEMRKDVSGLWFSYEFEAPVIPKIMWYVFEIIEDEQTYFYGNNASCCGGEGEIYYRDPKAYQMLVYDKEFHVPKWLRHSIMYQIFPDRFFNGNSDKFVVKKDKEYLVYSDWNSKMDLSYSYDGRIRNDFYGGNLLGILKKAEHLKSLNIGCIYLNPIFEAYSNHRYDTGDFMKIDPMLGSNEQFTQIAADLEQHGIKLILDGVFNHTGDDSVYFNRYGKYDSIGAAQGAASPYFDWFTFKHCPSEYECWWGIKNVPCVNEMTPSYLDFMLRGDNAVVKYWLRRGARGWRIDVADELPAAFLEMLRRHVKQADEQAVIIGEVWEDASNKVSYGELREYFLGKQLDSVMNYPFYDDVLAFINGYICAETLNRNLMKIQENYPSECLYSSMNIISTHDKPRAKTLFGGGGYKEFSPNDNTTHSQVVAHNKMKMAVVMQMTYIGVPCIYYGDEIGMTGAGDPENRGAFEWDNMNIELLEFYRAVTKIRAENICLQTGAFKTIFAEKNVFAFMRHIKKNKDVFGEKAPNAAFIIVLNNSVTDWADVYVDIEDLNIEKANKIVVEYGICYSNIMDDGKYKLSVPPTAGAIFKII